MSHDELVADRERMIAAWEKDKAERDYWKSKAQENWDILETVAVGEKLQCAKCKQYHPCRCDDGQ